MKAILVIDMPDECGKCPCYNKDLDSCKATEKHDYDDDEYLCDSKPNWCPLRELPRKRETQVLWIGEDKKPCIVTHEPSEYDEGWNDCVDFLLGEEE